MWPDGEPLSCRGDAPGGSAMRTRGDSGLLRSLSFCSSEASSCALPLMLEALGLIRGEMRALDPNHTCGAKGALTPEALDLATCGEKGALDP